MLLSHSSPHTPRCNTYLWQWNKNYVGRHVRCRNQSELDRPQIWRDWRFLLNSYSKPDICTLVHGCLYLEKIFITESTRKWVWNSLTRVLQNDFHFPFLRAIFTVHAKLLQINISLEPLHFYLCFHSAQENEVRLTHIIYILPSKEFVLHICLPN